MGVLHGGIVNALPDCRVKAVCEKENFVVKMAQRILPKDVTYYDDCTSMVENEDLDAAFITTSIKQHVPVIVELARTKPDVSLFVEKPLAESVDSARLACDAAGRLRGVHMVGFQKRYSPVYQHAKQLIENESIGDLMFFRAHAYSSDVLREGKSWRFKRGAGGVLLDLAPHLLDLLLWFFGETESVSGFRRNLYSKEVEDYAYASFVFKSGLIGHMDACWSVRGFRLPEILIEIYGKNGNIILNDDMIKIELAESSGNRESQVLHKQSFDNSVPFLLDEPEYTREDVSFLDCVSRGSTPVPDFFEASKVNMLIERIIEATSEEP
jgi:predicted dehydrogenase